MNREITEDMLASFRESYESDAQAQVLNAAAAQTDLADLAFIPAAAAKLEGPFSLEVKTRGITAQEKSGRCWCFAGDNILREVVAEKLNVDEFKLSNNYLTFFDKLEKANNYLTEVIDHADLPVSDRRMAQILHGIGDGNFFGPFVDLVKKYGVVPAEVMPETWQSSHTGTFMSILNILLKKDTAILRREIKAGNDVAELKEQMLAEIYRAECIVFGEPVTRFDYSYRDKDQKYHVMYDMTPKSFYDEYVGAELDNYVTVCNEPTERVDLNQTYTFHFGCNMADKKCLCLNLPLEEMKELALKQLEDGEPIWFACDSDRYGNRKKGIWDPASFNYGGILGGVDLNMTKSDALTYNSTHGCHAMILVGVNMDKEGNPDRWKIENSWGGEVGKNGYFVCSDRYFDEFVLEVVINKKHLSEKQLEILAETPVEIEPWEIY